MRISTYIDCLQEGSTQIRLDDTPKLLDTGFNCFISQLTPDALDTTKLDGKWLELCKAAKAQVIVVQNGLSLPQYQQLVVKYPGIVIGLMVADDANTMKPADVTKAINDATPFLNGTFPFIPVAKGSDHSVYAPLVGTGGYGVENYISPKILDGGGLKAVAYDQMVAAKNACQGQVYSHAFLGKNFTPYFGRNDPVWLPWEYVPVNFNEAMNWLGIIAGCTGASFYTAYAISNATPQYYARIAERWDILPAYKVIFRRMQKAALAIENPAAVKTLQVNTAVEVTAAWTLPDGSGIRVTVDLEEPRYPQVRILPFQPPVKTNLQITSVGPVDIKPLP